MKKVLTVAAVAEVATGLALLIVPSLVGLVAVRRRILLELVTPECACACIPPCSQLACRFLFALGVARLRVNDCLTYKEPTACSNKRTLVSSVS
jgi:hypothetical protein